MASGIPLCGHFLSIEKCLEAASGKTGILRYFSPECGDSAPKSMKPARFRYFAPCTVAEALNLLADHSDGGDGARVLAGGQSLVPLMNMRPAHPGVLVSKGVFGLRG